MNQKTSKAQIGYVLIGLSTVLFLAIFYLFFLNIQEGSSSLSVPLGLLPIAIINFIFGATLIAKGKS